MSSELVRIVAEFVRPAASGGTLTKDQDTIKTARQAARNKNCFFYYF